MAKRIVMIALNLVLAGPVFHQAVRAQQKPASPTPVVIPFELVTRHIFIKVRINNSAPLSLIFDTGDKFAIVDLRRAKALGLTLHGEVGVGGAGAGTVRGSMVQEASLNVIGVEGSPQPVVLAMPLDGLEPRFGHDIDGIIGFDFIRLSF